MRVRADRHCLSVAAASILAKVVRDREMRALSDHYPNWSFDSNKGYPCPDHKAALQGYGPSAIHRRTWIFMDHYVPWPGVTRISARTTDPVLTARRTPPRPVCFKTRPRQSEADRTGWLERQSS